MRANWCAMALLGWKRHTHTRTHIKYQEQISYSDFGSSYFYTILRSVMSVLDLLYNILLQAINFTEPPNKYIYSLIYSQCVIVVVGPWPYLSLSLSFAINVTNIFLALSVYAAIFLFHFGNASTAYYVLYGFIAKVNWVELD